MIPITSEDIILLNCHIIKTLKALVSGIIKTKMVMKSSNGISSLELKGYLIGDKIRIDIREKK